MEYDNNDIILSFKVLNGTRKNIYIHAIRVVNFLFFFFDIVKYYGISHNTIQIIIIIVSIGHNLLKKKKKSNRYSKLFNRRANVMTSFR